MQENFVRRITLKEDFNDAIPILLREFLQLGNFQLNLENYKYFNIHKETK